MNNAFAELEQIFKPGGVLQGSLSAYEFRPSQLQMAKAVLAAILDSTHLCVEAGTGTGKTLSYLIPALFCQKRVIISTATKNLQEQLFFKDIPFVCKHLFPELKATYMKGRQNYLCLKRFRNRRTQSLFAGTELERISSQISSWAQRTKTGDRAEIGWLGDDDPLWRTVDARSDTCIGRKCELFSECFVTRMRQRALESDLVVVNHALFFANLALEADEIGKILPDFSVLILDEAHEVEDIAADHFGKKLTNYQVEDFCRRLRKAFPEPSGMTPLITKLEASSRTFFDTFPGGEGRHSLSHFAGGVAPSTDLRVELGNYQDELVSSLLAIYHHLEGDRSGPEETDAFVKRADSYLTSLEELFSMDNPENVYWYEKSGRGVLVHVAPIKVSNLLREKLFGRADTVILASATLTAAGDFGYLKERLGVTESEDVIVQGEFDYSSQTALYIPKNAPQPGGNGAFEYLFEEILRLLDITSGHAFLLFTSVKQMVRVYRALEREVEYPVFCQGEKPKSQLLEEFKLTSGAVLCATSSFWQGVDVQGDALRAVVIDKLPFHVPTEPLVAARLNSLQNEGKNPFLEYSVPEAIINLRQGLGRLIRSRSDTGILAILDSRLWKKTYGKHFLNSLPNCLVTDNMEKLENFFRRSVSKNTEG